MINTPRIDDRDGEQAVLPGGIALPQYESRARRCSACVHRLPAERNRCALMPNHPPHRLGVAVMMTYGPMQCPDARWDDANAPQADIASELTPQPSQPTMIDRLTHGASGLAKAALGIDRADDATIATRYALCMACDRHAIGLCTACGCLCAAKVRVAGEACPEGKWNVATARQAE
jgi:hypothetical protein